MVIGPKTRQLGLAIGILGLGIVITMSVPACSTASPHGSADASTSANPPAAVPQAEQLLTKPTPSLVKQAAADHVLTANEQTLVAVYWSFLAHAYTTGEYDPVFLKSGLQDAVVQLT